MALPDYFLDRLFGRLVVRYGDSWLRKWDGIPMAAVRADWAEVLDGLSEAAIGYGLQYLPGEFPPTAPAFRALCNQRPARDTLALPSPPPSPEGVAKVRSLLAEIAPPADPRAWAKKLIERRKAGDPVSSKALEMARSALAAKPGEMAAGPGGEA
jgi:hypothetical protein